ncbi:YceI family protein [Mucilaginibacter sp. BJC16-A38]|uniref:YceI family protein n=1 Tax=Mucilaginibacter phenanthrenivorans TaxID=1234842 RepID=UPI0021579536|nr:YceI family protein [Mucilaginibacter phenanthrenivorans]MCR8560341.1 YceI family protein [Mucilaginibacter phenanthrenivorans]
MRYNWEISAASSLIEFSFKYYEIGRIKGYFKKFGGEITAGNHFDNPEIKVWIGAESVSTHNKACDRSLVSPAFLSVKEYPAIEFTASHGCRLSEGGIQELSGNLRIRNITNCINLLVTSSDIKNLKKELNAQYSLTTSFSLIDYGFNAGDGIFGDIVSLNVRLVLHANLIS